MKGNHTVWNYYLVTNVDDVYRPWTVDIPYGDGVMWDILCQKYPGLVWLHELYETVTISGPNSTDLIIRPKNKQDVILFLYGLTSNKKFKKAFESERDMNKFICIPMDFPDDYAMNEYLELYGGGIIGECGNEFITSSLSKNGNKIKPAKVHAIKSITCSEYSTISDLEYNAEYDDHNLLISIILPHELDDILTLSSDPLAHALLVETKLNRKYSDSLHYLCLPDILNDIFNTYDYYPYRGAFESFSDNGIHIDQMLAYLKLFMNTLAKGDDILHEQSD